MAGTTKYKLKNICIENFHFGLDIWSELFFTATHTLDISSLLLQDTEAAVVVVLEEEVVDMVVVAAVDGLVDEVEAQGNVAAISK